MTRLDGGNEQVRDRELSRGHLGFWLEWWVHGGANHWQQSRGGVYLPSKASHRWEEKGRRHSLPHPLLPSSLPWSGAWCHSTDVYNPGSLGDSCRTHKSLGGRVVTSKKIGRIWEQWRKDPLRDRRQTWSASSWPSATRLLWSLTTAYSQSASA